MTLFTFVGRIRSGMMATGVAAFALAGCPAGDDGTEDTMNQTTLPGTGSGGNDDGGMTEPADGTDTTGADDGAPSTSHAADIQPIWEKYCVDACHEPGGLWPTFDQSGDADENYEQIVGMPAPTQAPTMNLIEPGDPEASYMWHKINGTHIEVGGTGVVMPDKRPDEAMAMMLTEDELALLEQWILDGAPE